VLDSFTERDLEVWASRTVDLQSYLDRVYFDLERQRAAHYDELCAALRAVSAISLSLDAWVRVTDWRWSLTPLSPAGSLKGIGGRFNIGDDLDRARGQAFPCLYLARDIDTAYREYFGGSLSDRAGKMTLGEFALRRATSFTTFSLRGNIDQVFDLRAHTGLANFARIVSRFDVTKETKAFARKSGLRQSMLVRTPNQLWKRLLLAPAAWRAEPQMSGIPAPSQIFGRFLRDAGFDAVLYASQRGGSECLAIFPENFGASSSHIEVAGTVPPEATCIVMDRDHLCLDGS
jgi:RES domain-containing protein